MCRQLRISIVTGLFITTIVAFRGNAPSLRRRVRYTNNFVTRRNATRHFIFLWLVILTFFRVRIFCAFFRNTMYSKYYVFPKRERYYERYSDGFNSGRLLNCSQFYDIERTTRSLFHEPPFFREYSLSRYVIHTVIIPNSFVLCCMSESKLIGNISQSNFLRNRDIRWKYLP